MLEDSTIVIRKWIGFLSVFLKLSRIDSCIFTSLIVLFPIYYHKRDLVSSMMNAIPILTIMMCGFIANDINDIEKDVINHPDRPLPSRELTITCAVILYFLLLAITLILIKANIKGFLVIHYIVFLIGITNYNYIVEYFPWSKNFYVAAIGIMPIVIAVQSIGLNAIYFCIALSFALFTLGREILMDIIDAEGDKDSLALRMGETNAFKLAFGIQFVGLAMLIPLCGNSYKVLLLFLMAVLSIISMIMWNKKGLQYRIIMNMKIQMILGLIFLT